MKYTKTIPDADENLRKTLISDGWTKLKEPSNLVSATFLSIPFMIINGIISIIIAFYLYAPIREVLNNSSELNVTFTINLTFLLYIVAMVLFMALHEFIHAAFIPNLLKSDKTYWGLNGLFGFVYTTEKIKKNRYFIISVMPFMLLSVILPFLLNVLGYLNLFTLFLCLLNSMGSCVEFLNMFLIATQVPKGSYIINNGLETYFK
jgi:magnesium-transporting ATPase (P-type)